MRPAAQPFIIGASQRDGTRMARRIQGRHYRPSAFEAAFGAALLVGLPAAIVLPNTFDGKFRGVIAAFVVSLGIALGVALAKRRRAAASARPYSTPRDPVADFLALCLPLPAPDAGRWSLELLQRLDWRCFEDICGTLFAAAELRARARHFGPDGSIELVDGPALLARISAALPPATREALRERVTAGDYLAPTCPACGVKMAARVDETALRRFWGCVNHPRCEARFVEPGRPPI